MIENMDIANRGVDDMVLSRERSKPTVESWFNRKSSRFCRIRRGRNYSYLAWPNGQRAWGAINDGEGR
jgi:hypothetical protein